MNRFTINDDNTVTDATSGLTWTRNTVATAINFDAAEKAVSALGAGWRLPTADELFALADRSTHSPAIDKETFPGTVSDWYWTSTPCAWNASAVWVVGFLFGSVLDHPRFFGACVRAVRASSAGQ